ncbi:hypothetical protein D8M34_05800 [Microbacterium sp. HSID17254]|nr:hypothetical protein D8M34_05800 [Microbacterium sp. HSID17254]
MGISFAGGAYNRASGTRSAFDGLSNDLEREGHPPMVSISGDREPEDQERIWYERMTLSPGNRKVYGYRYWQGQKWYQIHPDTVAPPRTSNHEARRSNDLKWPYNSDTPAARRAKELGKRHNITREGENFRELWHWTHWGPLGHIEALASAGGSAPTTAIPHEEDEDMRIIVVNNNYYAIAKQFLSHLNDKTQVAEAEALYGPARQLGNGNAASKAGKALIANLDLHGIPRDVLDGVGRVKNPESGKFEANGTWSRERELLARPTTAKS